MVDFDIWCKDFGAGDWGLSSQVPQAAAAAVTEAAVRVRRACEYVYSSGSYIGPGKKVMAHTERLAERLALPTATSPNR